MHLQFSLCLSFSIPNSAKLSLHDCITHSVVTHQPLEFCSPYKRMLSFQYMNIYSTHDDIFDNFTTYQDISIYVLYPLIVWYIIDNIVYKAESTNITCVIKLVHAPVNPSCHISSSCTEFITTSRWGKSLVIFIFHNLNLLRTVGKKGFASSRQQMLFKSKYSNIWCHISSLRSE